MEISSLKSPFALLGAGKDDSNQQIKELYDRQDNQSKPKITTIESEYDSAIDKHYIAAAFQCIQNEKRREIFKAIQKAVVTLTRLPKKAALPQFEIPKDLAMLWKTWAKALPGKPFGFDNINNIAHLDTVLFYGTLDFVQIIFKVNQHHITINQFVDFDTANDFINRFNSCPQQKLKELLPYLSDVQLHQVSLGEPEQDDVTVYSEPLMLMIVAQLIDQIEALDIELSGIKVEQLSASVVSCKSALQGYRKEKTPRCVLFNLCDGHGIGSYSLSQIKSLFSKK